MKLKCIDHDKRVMVIGDKSIHRNDGSKCSGEVVIGNFRGYAHDVFIERFIQGGTR